MPYQLNSNPSIFRRLKAVLRNVNPFTPIEVPLLPVLVANSSDSYSENQVQVEFVDYTSQTLGDTGNREAGGVFVTAVTLTALFAAGDAGKVSVNALINGVAKKLLVVSGDGVLLAQSVGDSSTISFPFPIKIDTVANNITITTTGTPTVMGAVWGYQL